MWKGLMVAVPEIRNPQSAIRNRENPQSAIEKIRNPQSTKSAIEKRRAHADSWH